MENRQDPSQVHCYTNPSFCRQSEYMHEDNASQSSDSVDLPPPPQLQDDLPPPPAILQPQPQYGQTNPAFHGSPEANLNLHPQQPPPPHHRSVVNLNRTTADRYCYIDDDVDEPPPPNAHRRVGSLPHGSRQAYAYRTNRYEYIQDDASVQVQVQLQPHHQQQQLQQQQQLLQQQLQQPIATVTANNSRYEFIEQQQLQQRAIATPPPQYQQTPPPHMLPMSRQNSIRGSVRSYRTPDPHYTTLGPDGVRPHDPAQWNEDDGQGWNTSRRQKSTPRGRYTSVPMQDEDPPCLPERNGLEAAQLQQQQQRPMNNMATQKLHEILTTPRKPRSRSQGDLLSPVKSPQHHQQPGVHGLQRGGSFTPGCSPSSSATGHRAMNSPAAHQSTPHQSRALSPRGPTTSTPNKEPPAARRCLPLYEPQQIAQQIAQQRQPQHHLVEPPQTVVYGRTTQRYDEGVYAEKPKASLYQGVEGAFIARTAVVPPLSPPTSEANTTLVSGTEKSSIRNAPIILVLVGILTCGLGIYLSWSQGRRYYYDSAIGCGACCTLAGACRSMRRAWTSLSLAFLALLSCCGLLILAAKSPRPGTPLHDVTAGALCGVSLLGAALALLALVAPRCTFGRHRRVHSWIPSFSP